MYLLSNKMVIIDFPDMFRDPISFLNIGAERDTCSAFSQMYRNLTRFIHNEQVSSHVKLVVCL